jgi:hypothetical protein
MLSDLLKRAVSDRDGQPVGLLADVIVRLRGADYPVVTAIVVAMNSVHGRRVFIHLEDVASLDDPTLVVNMPDAAVRPFARREGEVLLRADVLGHRLINVHAARFTMARDLELARDDDGWVLRGVDISPPHRLLARLAGRQPSRVCLDWTVFEPLIGHTPSRPIRLPHLRTRRLKPAQLADLLEAASSSEESELLHHVHANPELEADVFEELDEDVARRLLGARTDEQIAAMVARMGADDAADTIIGLPQRRRRPVLDLLPPVHRRKVTALMGFNPTSVVQLAVAG